jgi:alcohol dehydrogenase
VSDLAIKIAPEILIGTDIINRAGAICKVYGNRVLLITEKSLLGSEAIERLAVVLADSGVEAILFSDISPLSMADKAENAAALARAGHCSAVIGFGGSEVLSIARATALIAAGEIDVFELLEGKNGKTFLPYIAIPSIKEDPFLLADSFIAVDPRDRAVRLIHTLSGSCRALILDGDFSARYGDPSLAFDGFCVAVEAYCSKKANIFSDPLLESAVAFYGRIISAFLHKNEDDNRELFAKAGFLAAMGAAVSAPGVVSVLAYGVAARFPVEKSMCAAIMLPFVLDKLADSRAEKMAKVAFLMGEKTEGLPVAEAALLPAASIRDSLKKLNVFAPLESLGLKLDRLVSITESVRNFDITAFSPWTVTSEEILNIVKTAF